MNEAAPAVSDIQIDEMPFAQELLYLRSFTDAMSRLHTTGMSSRMSDFVDDVIPRKPALPQLSEETVAPVRAHLAEMCNRLEFAESGQGEKFLSTAPLRALAKEFQDQPPAAVIIGSKGSGKTYTYLQLVRAKYWSNFAGAALNVTMSAETGCIWPVLHSSNLQASALQLVDACKRQAATDLHLTNSFTQTNVEDAIRESLSHDRTDETWWRHRWFTLISRSMGLAVGAENEASSRLIDELRRQAKPATAVVDGLEDLFQDIETRPVQQTALRALLKIPNYLREVPDNPLGVVIFVRADLVRAAIPQNVKQFARQYQNYSLRWNQEEALRLAAWLATESGVQLQLLPSRNIETLTGEEARNALVPLWGKKLGPENSKEARTAEWVVAALSDFLGQIQARDLVRLLRYSAEKSAGLPVGDRVLPARAIRDAIRPCSDQKVQEIKQEIPPLKDIFEKLQRQPDKRIPFDALEYGLKAEEIHFLESIGVVLEESGQYYLPEIFRLGLGFLLPRGARPKVLSLARRSFETQSPL